MAKTIVALFDTPAEADAARRDVMAAGFTELEIDLIRHSGYGAGEGYGDVLPQLKGWGVPDDDAVAYAEGLRRGGALLVVSPQDDDAATRAVAALDTRSSAQNTADPTGRSAEWRATGWSGEPPPAMPKPPTPDADRRLGDAAEALRDANAEAVPPPPHPGTAAASHAPDPAVGAAPPPLAGVGHLPSAAQPFITAMLRRRISASAADWEST